MSGRRSPSERMDTIRAARIMRYLAARHPNMNWRVLFATASGRIGCERLRPCRAEDANPRRGIIVSSRWGWGPSAIGKAPAAMPSRGQANPRRGIIVSTRWGWGPSAIGKRRLIVRHLMTPAIAAGIVAAILGLESDCTVRPPAIRTGSIPAGTSRSAARSASRAGSRWIATAGTCGSSIAAAPTAAPNRTSIRSSRWTRTGRSSPASARGCSTFRTDSSSTAKATSG